MKQTPAELSRETGLARRPRAKHELVCAKLDSCGSESVLDIGCGCGSFALHAAREHGVLRHRNPDYGDLAGESCDAIASIGIVEHVGSENIEVLDYARTLSGWARKPRRARRARRIAGRRERVRVWRLYLRAAVRGFENRFTSIFQILGAQQSPRGTRAVVEAGRD